MAPADKGPLTITVTAPEVTASEGELLSFTCSWKDQVPAVTNMPVDEFGVSPMLQENEVPRSLKVESNGPFFSH